MTATIKTVRDRFRTLTAACDEIVRLEQQVIGLNAALVASKTAPPAKVQIPAQPTNPAVSQPQPAGSLPMVERPLADLSRREIADLMDEANARGDKLTTDRLWREYCSRK
jgi:hypothetical protein